MLVVANKKEEAIDLLQKCIKKDDQNPEYYNYLGVAFQKSGDFQSALTNYKKAIELDGNFALPWSNMGSLYLMAFLKNKNERDFQRAIDNFNTALAFDPGLQAAINGKNAAYKFKEQIDK
jgi:tetratricopeptide (TPR) repeat protein